MRLTEKQIEKGYWYYRPTENFPPDGKLLEEYNNEERLNLFATKGNESDSERKRREKNYATEIPTKLKSTKILWADHINQETFNAICELENLSSLYIQSNRIKDISAISKLKNLKHLALLNLTKVENITPFSKLNYLITLELENFKKVSDFNPISKLINLQGLQIDGDMYNAQKIDDLSFLTNLTDLEYLTFTNSKATIKDLSPILKLQNLKMFQCSTNYPKKEFQTLKGMNNIKYLGGNIKPLIKNES